MGGAPIASFCGTKEDLEEDDEMEFTPKIIAKLLDIIEKEDTQRYWEGCTSYFIELLFNYLLNPTSKLVDFFEQFKGSRSFKIVNYGTIVKDNGEEIRIFGSGSSAGNLLNNLLDKDD